MMRCTIFMLAPRMLGAWIQPIEAHARNMPERFASLVRISPTPCPKKRMPAFVAPAFDRGGREPCLAERARRDSLRRVAGAERRQLARKRHGRGGDHRRQEQSSGPHGRYLR